MRVKAGTVTRRRHKKIVKKTKGSRYSYHKTYKRAHEAAMHAGMYSYKHRRKRVHTFRKLWIMRINAAVRKLGYKYSTFIAALKQSKIALNLKMLSELAINSPKAFAKIVEQAFKNFKGN